jgi:hypothetical protein
MFSVLAITFTTCDEQLPSHIDPTIPLTGSLDAIYFGPVDPKVGTTQNAFNIYFSIRYPTGSFDETLQGEAEMTANLDIVWLHSPSYRKHITLDKKSVVEIRKSKYNIDTNILTMDPGEEMSFFYAWDFGDNDGVFIPDLFRLVTDSLCVFRDTMYTADSVYVVKSSYPRKSALATFEISGNAKLFKHFAVCYAPASRFSIVWFNKICHK